MKKLNLILGIVCLLITAGLVIANLTLPASSLWFDIGYGNMPWAPPIIFGIIGIILLATAGIGRASEATAAQQPTPEVVQDPDKVALNKRLESIGWGCFLILWAGSMFWKQIAPGTPLPEGLLVDRRRVDLPRPEPGPLPQQDPHEWVHHFPRHPFRPWRRGAVVRRQRRGRCLPAAHPGRISGAQAVVRPAQAVRQG